MFKNILKKCLTVISKLSSTKDYEVNKDNIVFTSSISDLCILQAILVSIDKLPPKYNKIKTGKFTIYKRKDYLEIDVLDPTKDLVNPQLMFILSNHELNMFRSFLEIIGNMLRQKNDWETIEHAIKFLAKRTKNNIGSSLKDQIRITIDNKGYMI